MTNHTVDHNMQHDMNNEEIDAEPPPAAAAGITKIGGSNIRVKIKLPKIKDHSANNLNGDARANSAAAAANREKIKEEMKENGNVVAAGDERHTTRYEQVPKMDTSSGDDDDSGSPEREQPQKKPGRVCELCSRTFPSVKSLHGHMRNHSDRDWRGMTRPAGAEISSSSSAQPKVKGKKASKASQVPSKPKPVEAKREAHHTHEDPLVAVKAYLNMDPNLETNPEQTAALILVRMRLGPLFDRTNQSQVLQEKGLRGRTQPDQLPVDDTLGNVSTTSETRHVDTERVEMPYSDDQTNDIAGLLPDKKMEKNMNVKIIDKKYQCVTCDKWFDTHQALGGHRASHNKDKGSGQELEEGEILEETKEESSKDGEVHACNKCGMTFSKGQALGGHKRKHYIPPLLQSAEATQSPPRADSEGHPAASAPPPPVVEEDCTQVEKPRNIDLNAPPNFSSEGGDDSGEAC